MSPMTEKDIYHDTSYVHYVPVGHNPVSAVRGILGGSEATADGETDHSIVHEEDISLCHEATLAVTADDEDIGVHARALSPGA